MVNVKFLISLAIMSIGFLAHFWFDEKIIDKNNLPCPFPYPKTLPFNCRFFNVISGFFILLKTKSQIVQNPIPYFGVAFLMSVCIYSSTLAKLKIDYASLNVFKSAKPVAIMILSIFIFKKKIPKQRIISVLVLCFGLILFRIEAISGSKNTEMIAYLYIAIELFSEGLYSPLIDKLNKKTNNPYITMFYTHLGRMLIMFLLNPKEIINSFIYITKNPAFIPQILGLVLTGVIAQAALFTVLSLSDGLVLSIVTTTRKFCTIVISSLYFGHKFSVIQWIGVVVVFTALAYDIFSKKSTKEKEQKEDKPKQE